eukprot:Sspe_Gene.91797::Locus_63420_Transcript_1_1_Confidence_1.000_Length_1447::g.91797::m.91797
MCSDREARRKRADALSSRLDEFEQQLGSMLVAYQGGFKAATPPSHPSAPPVSAPRGSLGTVQDSSGQGRVGRAPRPEAMQPVSRKKPPKPPSPIPAPSSATTSPTIMTLSPRTVPSPLASPARTMETDKHATFIKRELWGTDKQLEGIAEEVHSLSARLAAMEHAAGSWEASDRKTDLLHQRLVAVLGEGRRRPQVSESRRMSPARGYSPRRLAPPSVPRPARPGCYTRGDDVLLVEEGRLLPEALRRALRDSGWVTAQETAHPPTVLVVHSSHVAPLFRQHSATVHTVLLYDTGNSLPAFQEAAALLPPTVKLVDVITTVPLVVEERAPGDSAGVLSAVLCLTAEKAKAARRYLAAAFGVDRMLAAHFRDSLGEAALSTLSIAPRLTAPDPEHPALTAHLLDLFTVGPPLAT